MSYGLKYELHGCSVPFNKNWKVRIYQSGYTGVQIDRDVPSNPFQLKKDSAGTIRGTSLDFSIRSIVDFEFIEMYTNVYQDWMITLIDNEDTEIWQGFILPENYQEDYSPAPVNVTFTATDQLGLLKNFTYTAPGTARISYLSILINCLANTGLSLGFSIATAMWESRQNIYKSALSEIYIDPTVYNTMNCYDVVSDILMHFDADITQQNCTWLIRSSISKQDARINYDATGIYESQKDYPVIKTLARYGSGDIYPTGSPLILSLATAERIVEIIEDYGTKVNILPQQDTTHWTDDNTLPGWTGVNAHTKRVNTSLPYLLVQAINLTAYTAYAIASVGDLVSSTDTMEFSFDYAFIATYYSNITAGFYVVGSGQPVAKISVMVTLYDTMLGTTWYLSNKVGWTHTLSRLEISNVEAAGGITILPTWNNYKVIASTIPASGILSVYLYAPGYNYPEYTVTSGAGFQNVILNILPGAVANPSGLDYKVILNNSTQAAANQINLIGGDVPDVSNKILLFGSYTSLSNYKTTTGTWQMPNLTSVWPLTTLIAKIHASENRKAKQYLKGIIRGEIIDFDTIIQHDYPVSRKFEILEANYSLCLDSAEVTLLELFDYEDQTFTSVVTDATLSTTSGTNTTSGSAGNSNSTVTPTVNYKYLPPWIKIPIDSPTNAPVVLFDDNYSLVFSSQFPNVKLFTFNADGSVYERDEKPIYSLLSNGNINTITWDLPDSVTGFIILT